MLSEENETLSSCDIVHVAGVVQGIDSISSAAAGSRQQIRAQADLGQSQGGSHNDSGRQHQQTLSGGGEEEGKVVTLVTLVAVHLGRLLSTPARPIASIAISPLLTTAR